MICSTHIPISVGIASIPVVYEGLAREPLRVTAVVPDLLPPTPTIKESDGSGSDIDDVPGYGHNDCAMSHLGEKFKLCKPPENL